MSHLGRIYMMSTSLVFKVQKLNRSARSWLSKSSVTKPTMVNLKLKIDQDTICC